MSVIVSPSMLSCDFTNLRAEIKSIEEAGCDYLHLDVMDGQFVPNITFGPLMIDACKKITKLPLDVHLMIINPENYIEQFAKAGADLITIHAESTTHLHRQIQFIKSFGCKAGVVLNPSSPLDLLEYVIDECDAVLLMSVNPGFSGQSFIPQILNKVDEFYKRYRERLCNGFLLEVDGGVNEETAPLLVERGVNMLVSGSYFFKSKERKKIVEYLKSL